jgi:hypothetical protein
MKLKKFEQQPKHVDNIPIEAINLDSEQEQPPNLTKLLARMYSSLTANTLQLLYMVCFLC